MTALETTLPGQFILFMVFCGVAGRCVKDYGTPDLVQEVFGTKSHKSHTGHTPVTHQSHTKKQTSTVGHEECIFFGGTS